MIETAKRLIKEYNLTDRSRVRAKNYKRIIVANLLNNEGHTYQAIGILLKRDHSTIINMLKVHKELSQYADFRKAENDLLDGVIKEPLIDRVLGCETLRHLKQLQEELKKDLQ